MYDILIYYTKLKYERGHFGVAFPSAKQASVLLLISSIKTIKKSFSQVRSTKKWRYPGIFVSSFGKINQMSICPKNWTLTVIFRNRTLTSC